MKRPTGVRFYTPRDPEFVRPGTDAWRSMITPSKVAAILGEPGDPVSRYESPFRLWMRMTGRVEPEEPRDAFDLGHDVEHLAAARYRRDRRGWLLSPDEVQAHVDPDKFGFPAIATLDRRGVSGASRRVVEFKMARNLNDLEVWGDDLKGDLPDDYHAQVTALMLFTGWTDIPGELLAIGPFLEHRIYTVDYDRSFAALILQKCRAFYASLSGDEPPELDNTLATYQCVRAMHPDIDRDTSAIVDPGQGLDYVSARERFESAEVDLRFEKTKLLNVMERCQYATANGVRIADRRNTGKGGVALYANKSATVEQIEDATP